LPDNSNDELVVAPQQAHRLGRVMALLAPRSDWQAFDAPLLPDAARLIRVRMAQRQRPSRRRLAPALEFPIRSPLKKKGSG
jgi:hypothetical protein